MEESRLRWQCRRGMRELDVLLTGFLDREYRSSSDLQKQAFRQLLALPDPDLVGYLLGGASPDDPELASLIERIRR